MTRQDRSQAVPRPEPPSGALPEDPAAVWVGLRAGDEAILAGTWSAIRAQCAPYLCLRGVPGAELEGLLHEVFESTCRCAERRPGEPPRHFAGFLKGRARGVFSTWARGRQRWRRFETLEDRDGAQDREPAPDEALQREDERRAVRRWIEHCRDRLDASLYRPVWSLRYEAGLDLTQIADWLGRSYEAVAVQVHRANKQMRECLQSKGVAP